MFHPLSEFTLLPLMPNCIKLFGSVSPFICSPFRSALLLSCIVSPGLDCSLIVFVDPFFVVFRDKFIWNVTLDRKHYSFIEQVLEVSHSAEVAGPAVPQRRTFVHSQLQEPALRSALTQSVEGVRQHLITQQHLDTESALLTTVVAM
jgi:hypothetical protein